MLVITYSNYFRKRNDTNKYVQVVKEIQTSLLWFKVIKAA